MHSRLLDPLDGSPAVEVVTFSLDGVEYRIPLNAEHAAQLRAGVKLFVRRARVVSRRPRTVSAGRAAPRRDAAQTEAIRRWAVEHGYEIVGKRLSDDVVSAWEDAHR